MPRCDGVTAGCVDPPVYPFGTPTSGTPGNDYKLCWAHDPASIADFRVELDPTVRDSFGPAI